MVKQKLMMACATTEASVVSSNWSDYDLEPKYDGFRAGIIKENGEVTIYSRTWHEQQHKLPHIVETCKSFDGDFHIDGELVYVKKWERYGRYGIIS